MLIFSLTLEPLNTSVSVPSWPSTTSLPSPGFQTNVSSPAPSCAASLPRPPMMTSLPSPPISVSVAGPRDRGVVAGSAEQLGGGQRAVGLVERNRIVAALAEPLDGGRVGDGGLAAIDGHGAAVHEKLSSRVATSHDGVIDAVAEFGK